MPVKKSVDWRKLGRSIRRGFKRLSIRYIKIPQKSIFIYAVIFSILLATISSIKEEYSIIPLGFYTSLWIMASAFPTLAMTYFVARVGVRATDVIDLSHREDVWSVYISANKAEDDEDRQLDFEQYVYNRLTEYYNAFEYAVFSILAGATTFIIGYILANQLEVPTTDGAWVVEEPKWAIVTGTGFLGAYSGSVVLMLRRYGAFNLSPTMFLQAFVVLVAGTLFASCLNLAFPFGATTALISFLVSFLSAINISFLSQEVRRQYSQLTGHQLPEDITSDLPEMVRNGEVVEALKRMSINSIRELSFSDPIRLYFNIPQELRTTVAMLDEAVLRANFQICLAELQNVHIGCFTQLVLRLEPTFADGTVKWPSQPPHVLDEGGRKDDTLLKACRDLVSAGVHHVLLGLLISGYRREFFSIANVPSRKPTDGR